MARDVFISYSSKDKKAAEAVCAKLESEKIKCWIAPRDIPPGARYAQSIINGINTSRLMIFIFSSHAGDSEHIESEIDRAYDKRIPIIPLRLEDIPLSGSLEYYLSTAQWFNALTPPLDEHLERLPEVVRQLLETDTNTASVTAAPPRPTPAGLPPQSNRQNLFNAITPLKVTIGLFLIAAILTSMYFFQSQMYFFQSQKKKTGDNVEGNNVESNNAVTTSDSIVVDSRNNLMWTKGDNGAAINWSDAVKYCEDLALGGFNDWRLPSKLDLKATNDSDIPESNRIWKAIQVKEKCCFWASNDEDENHALGYNFTSEIQKFVKSNKKEFRALCVRHSEN